MARLPTTAFAAGLGRRTNVTAAIRGTESPEHVSLPARPFFDVGWQKGSA